jgi:hypothetical protein
VAAFHPEQEPMNTRHLGLMIAVLALGPARAGAQVSGAWSKCNQDSLSTWNCARYYDGTVTLTSSLKTPQGTTTTAITATVTGGKVTCTVNNGEAPEYSGPGMLVVEHAGTTNAGKYAIQVWCPESAGKRPTRESYPVIEEQDLDAPDYAALAGKDEHEHPDADAVNGVSGTETIAWNLKRP